jgi:hypothetical protein
MRRQYHKNRLPLSSATLLAVSGSPNMAFIPFPFGAVSTAMSLLLMHGISITMFRAFLNQTIPSLETLRTNDKYHITFTRPGSSFKDSSPPSVTNLPTYDLAPRPPPVESSSTSGSPSTLPHFPLLQPSLHPSLPLSSMKSAAENLLTSASSRNPLFTASTGRFNLINPLYQNAISSNPMDRLIFSSAIKSLPAPNSLHLMPTSRTTSHTISLLSPNANDIGRPQITFTPLLSKRVGDVKNTIVFPLVFKNKPFKPNQKSKVKNGTLLTSKKNTNKGLMVNTPIVQEISISTLTKSRKLKSKPFVRP